MIDQTQIINKVSKGQFVTITAADCGREMAALEGLLADWLIYSRMFFTLVHKDHPAEVVVLVPAKFEDYLMEREGHNIIQRLYEQGIVLEDYFHENDFRFCMGATSDLCKIWAHDPEPSEMMYAELGNAEYVLERIFV